jgi:transcriptional regulator with PAS, ATPase and Fis domain
VPCGYSTCRDKAIAVFQHKAELEMCIPFMHSRAESLSNIVLETSPNAVVMVDSEMKIIEFSRASEKLFRKTRAEALKMYLVELIDPSDALYVYDSHADVRGRKVEYPDYQICTMQNIVYIPKQDAVLLTITDITQQEKEAALDYEQKMASAEMAQKVIEKQMTVAQQIAGLLGETTAETKTTLTKMCRSILKEGPEKKENLSEESESDKLRNFAQPPKVDTTYNDNSIVHDMGGDESGMGEL